MPRATSVNITPRKPASEFLIKVNRLQISLMIRDPYVARAAPWVKKYPYKDHPESEVHAIIVLEQLNPPQCYSVPRNRIYAIHKAVAYGPAAEMGGFVRSDQLMPIGAGIVPVLK
jgi:hypothetical protein